MNNTKRLKRAKTKLGLESLESRQLLAVTTADIVFVVDQSGSMTTEDTSWIAKVVGGDSSAPASSAPFLRDGLEQTLKDMGIGGPGNENRYGFTWFDASANAVQLDGSSLWGSADDLVNFANGVDSTDFTGLGLENGWSAIEDVASDSGQVDYGFRPGAAVRFILMSDEDTGIGTSTSPTVDDLVESIQAASPDAELDVIIDASIASTTGNVVVGATSRNKAIAFGESERLVVSMQDEQNSIQSGASLEENLKITIDQAPSALEQDSHGYSAKYAPDQPAASFNNIANTGSTHPVFDEVTDTIDIGFSFPFYGTQQTELYVSQNGILAFGNDPFEIATSEDTSDLNAKSDEILADIAKSYETPEDPVIAPFWAPLNSTIVTELQGSGSDQRLVVQWDNVTHNGVDGFQSNANFAFQAILHASGKIEFVYDSGFEYALSGRGVAGIKGSDATGVSERVESRVQTLMSSVRTLPNGVIGTLEGQGAYADPAWESGGTIWNLALLDGHENPNTDQTDYRLLSNTFVQEVALQVSMQSLDLTGDFVITADDIDAIFDHIGQNSPDHDLNNDGQVTAEDADVLLEELGTVRGDIDLNGKVEFADFLLLSTNFGKSDQTYADGDLDGDGLIGFSDFLLLSTNFGAG